jgi:hypothetical protein
MKYYPTKIHEEAAKKFIDLYSKDKRVMAILLTCSCARQKAHKSSCIDFAYFMRFSVVSASKGIDKRRMNLFLKEYEKQIKLSKIEKKMLIPLMIRGNVIVFWWMSEEMKKGLEKKYDRIRWTCKINKELVKAWERELK